LYPDKLGELPMSDDLSNRGSQDRARVSRSEPYEVGYIAEKHRITMDQARELIRKHGNNRAVLDAEAVKLRHARG
jgi:hypothetical protein